MTLGLLGQLNGKDCRLILDWIAGRSRDCEYIPGPSFDPDENMKYSGLDQEWVANYHTTLVACSALLLTEKNEWLLGAATAPIFDTSIDDIAQCGEVVSLLNRYEIPKAVAIIDSVTEWTEFAKFTANCVGAYLDDITDESTGIIGYWTDEIKAAEMLDSTSQLDSELRYVSRIAADILRNATKAEPEQSETSH